YPDRKFTLTKILTAILATWKSYIRIGLRHIEDETCIRFEEDGHGDDYLLFVRGDGCWSNIGRAGGSQRISIGPGCGSKGIIAHETLHALGLWHEQARSDRDDFVFINYENIKSGTEYNFEKRSIQTSDNMNQPYDFGSIMHYNPKSFSISLQRNSLSSYDPKYQQTMGQREAISFKDAKMINLRYCNETCKTHLNCFAGGYTDPNDCNKCKCPEGYAGIYCDKLMDSNMNICRGSELIAKDDWQYIENPFIQINMNCNWRISARPDRRVALYLTNLTFPEDDACANYVEVKYKQDKVTSGARLCGSPPKTVWLSEDFEVLVMMRTNYFVRKGWGFKLYYREADESERKIPLPNIVFTTPNPNEKLTFATSSIATTTSPPISSTSIPVTSTTTLITTTPTTTPTTVTTTVRTTKLTTTSMPGKWTEWAFWSECSTSCGGCGTRKRVRACYGGNKICSGKDADIESCGLEVCSNPDVDINHRCQGQIVMPCDLMGKLDFEASSGEIATFEEDDRVRVVKDDRQNCIKFFSYPCMTSLLTININKKNFGSTSNFLSSGTCCSGYYPSNGKCYKLKSYKSY
uniref:Zinc metalloproteinase n=1 Tax=Acrobeloides nanus TaxID=290746 RepID=A0A914CMT9_9BILA